MKLLRWLIVTVFLILTAVTGTIVLHGRGLPEVRTDQLQAMGVDTCEGKLCFMQVIPGVTTWNEAHRALSNYITRDEGDHFHGQVGRNSGRGRLERHDDHAGGRTKLSE